MKQVNVFMRAIALVLALCACMQAQAVVLVLQVNMSGITINSAGVHVAGSFNNWNPNGPLMTELGGGIYEQSFIVSANTTVQFKFINGANMSDGETVPSLCAVSGNRSVTIGTSDVLFGPYCFGQCGECDVTNPNTATVTFKVDMAGQTVSPNGVHIAGNFQNWSPSTTAMTLLSGTVYSYTTTVAAGTQVQYKFINGNDWPFAETVPEACGLSDGFGGFNRSFSVGSTSLILDAVCFGACEACAGASVNEEETLVKVWPNPTDGVLHVQTTHRPDQMHLFDLQGRIVRTWPSMGRMNALSVEGIPTGMYILRIAILDAVRAEVVSVR